MRGYRSVGLLAAIAALTVSAAVAAPRSTPAREATPSFHARSSAQLFAKRGRVAAVTVVLPAKSCAGAIVGSPTQVLTAAHCIPAGAEVTDVVYRGRTQTAVVALLDRTGDTALLALEEAVDAVPLELEAELPKPGDRVLFVGRVDRRSRPQVAAVERLGRCPSLPGVPDAVFTTLQARPGDSGAPILNDELKVVGVIHGGAACHIAAPTAALAAELTRLGRTPLQPEAEPESNPAPQTNPDRTLLPAPPVTTAEYRFGPFVFEKHAGAGAVRYRLRFQVGSE